MNSSGQPQAPARRSPIRRILAFVLVLLNPGLGLTVMGRPGRGLKWLIVALLSLGVFTVGVVAGHSYLAWLGLVLVPATRLAETVDTLRIPALVNPPRHSKLLLIGVVMIAAVTLGTEGLRRLARMYRLPTPAMYPTLESGDYIMTSHVWSVIERGDVIAYTYPLDEAKSYVHRVVGLPGDTIEIRDERLILNGNPVEMKPTDQVCQTLGRSCTIWRETIGTKTYSIALMNESRFAQPFGPEVIPEGHLFVLGDNRENSADSRYWGYVPMDLVLGKPRFVYLSWNESGIQWNRINLAVE